MNVRLSALLGLALLSAASFTVAQDLLPIQPGLYVRDGSSCHEPPFAAMIEYDGRALSGPHSGDCTSTIVSRSGTSYEVATTCRALGDGTPAGPTTSVDRIVVASPTDILDARAGDVADYHHCAAG